MITPISEAGKAIIRMYTDNEANIPAELRPFTNSPGELMAGEMKTAPEIELRSTYEIRRDTIIDKFR